MKRVKSKRHMRRFVFMRDQLAKLFHVQRLDTPSNYHRELRTAPMNVSAKNAQL